MFDIRLRSQFSILALSLFSLSLPVQVWAQRARQRSTRPAAPSHRQPQPPASLINAASRDTGLPACSPRDGFADFDMSANSDAAINAVHSRFSLTPEWLAQVDQVMPLFQCMREDQYLQDIESRTPHYQLPEGNLFSQLDSREDRNLIIALVIADRLDERKGVAADTILTPHRMTQALKRLRDRLEPILERWNSGLTNQENLLSEIRTAAPQRMQAGAQFYGPIDLCGGTSEGDRVVATTADQRRHLLGWRYFLDSERILRCPDNRPPIRGMRQSQELPLGVTRNGEAISMAVVSAELSPVRIDTRTHHPVVDVCQPVVLAFGTESSEFTLCDSYDLVSGAWVNQRPQNQSFENDLRWIQSVASGDGARRYREVEQELAEGATENFQDLSPQFASAAQARLIQSLNDSLDSNPNCRSFLASGQYRQFRTEFPHRAFVPEAETARGRAALEYLSHQAELNNPTLASIYRRGVRLRYPQRAPHVQIPGMAERMKTRMAEEISNSISKAEIERGCQPNSGRNMINVALTAEEMAQFLGPEIRGLLNWQGSCSGFGIWSYPLPRDPCLLADSIIGVDRDSALRTETEVCANPIAISTTTRAVCNFTSNPQYSLVCNQNNEFTVHLNVVWNINGVDYSLECTRMSSSPECGLRAFGPISQLPKAVVHEVCSPRANPRDERTSGRAMAPRPAHGQGAH